MTVPDEFQAVVRDAGEEPIVGTAWFSTGELRSAPETVYPEGLADLVERLATDQTSDGSNRLARLDRH